MSRKRVVEDVDKRVVEDVDKRVVEDVDPYETTFGGVTLCVYI